MQTDDCLTGLRLAKAFLALVSMFSMYFCALPSLLITLPRYIKLFTHSSVLPAIVRGVSKVVWILTTFVFGALIYSPTLLAVCQTFSVFSRIWDARQDSQIIGVVKVILVFLSTGRNRSLYASTWSYVGYSHNIIDDDEEIQWWEHPYLTPVWTSKKSETPFLRITPHTNRSSNKLMSETVFSGKL